MQWLGLTLIALLVLCWWGIRRFRKNRQPKLEISYRQALLDKSMREFKSRLEQAVGDRFDVFAQIRLADMLICEAAKDKASKAMLQQIADSTVDFVLTEKESGNIYCVVMLTRQDKAGSRQLFVRQVCQQSELPFLLLDVHNALTDKQIRHKITSLLEPAIVLDEPSMLDIKVYLEPGQSQDERQGVNINA